MTPEFIELVNASLISGYRLPVGVEELLSGEDEVVVFRDYFVARLVVLCHQFVLVVLDRHCIQLHELTPTGFAHLSKFTWAIVSYGSDRDIELFTRQFALHNQTR